MTDTAFENDTVSPTGRNRGQWIRLRTLIILRWIAIIGQIGAITVAQVAFGLAFNAGLVALTIGASVVANIVAVFTLPENRRLSETELAGILAFDLMQLGLLLFLTGGLNNPFALLILAPATIAATTLATRPTVILTVLTVIVATFLARFSQPILTTDGIPLLLPDLFRFGFWIAILIGVGFLSFYTRRVTSEMNAMSDALTATQMALARTQKLSDLDGVVAAAAHELGTPLATIKLASSELVEELVDQPELRDDAKLIGEQTDRCREILRSMGRVAKDDTHLHFSPIEAVVREAAEPHLERERAVRFVLAPSADETAQPVVSRRPEVVHGLRNLIQNAVDFSQSSVEVEIGWTDENVIVRIADDGPGFPTQVIGKIGDPFVRGPRPDRGNRSERPGYDGMGLGLFIAKTLLERSGADLVFANGPMAFGARGALVSVTWPRPAIEKAKSQPTV